MRAPPSVCAQLVPGARDRARRDQLLVVACEACGAPARLEPELLVWTDLERAEYVVVVPVARLPQVELLERRVLAGFTAGFLSGPQEVWADPHDVLLRLVFGGEGLAEKLIAWDAGLDDAVVEILKHALLNSEPARQAALEAITLMEVTAAGELVFAAAGRRLVVAPAAYADLASRRDWLVDTFPELYGGAWVDVRRYPRG